MNEQSFDWLPWRRLRALGIMGMNERNGDFILRYNPRKRFPLVDDKRQTKSLALAAGIAVPDLYAVVEIEHQIAELRQSLAAYEDFVVKPAHGSGGEGILVVVGLHLPFLLLLESVGVDASDGLHQGRLAMVNMACRANHTH